MAENVNTEVCPHCYHPQVNQLTDVNLSKNILLLHRLQAMLDEEREQNKGAIDPNNRDSWATAYIKARALRNMLDAFIRDISKNLPVGPRRML